MGQLYSINLAYSIRSFGCGAKWLKLCETANFILRYSKAETKGELKEGTVH